MDETGLQYKMTPTNVLAPREVSKVSGPKKQLERITIGACCNADGSFKLPLMVIGKSKNPRCFKNIDKDHLPVWYTNQQNAWVDFPIFKEWFEKEFVPRVENFLFLKNLDLRAILIVDNCRSHRYLKVRNIEVVFLRANVTSIVQPLDQGIIMTLKINYQSLLIEAFLKAQERGICLVDFLKTLQLSQVILMIAESWEKIKAETICKCWRKLIPVKKQDAFTQTDDTLMTSYTSFYDLDSESNLYTESADSHLINASSRNVKDLQKLLHKIEGYEHVDAKTILRWLQNSNCGKIFEIIFIFHSSILYCAFIM